MEVDLSEAIDQREGGYWFDFEQIVVSSQKAKAPVGVQSEGDRVAEQRGPCRFYLKGHCVKGRECPYRHLTTERTVVCKHWLNDLCKKGDDCEFLHEYNLAKMPECNFFSKYGECHNADCLYRHLDQNDKASECPWYARGHCKHGDKCRHRHVQSVLCDNYRLGFCPDGPKCKFAHPSWSIPGMADDKFPGSTPRLLICRICGKQGHKARECPQYSERSSGRRKLGEVICFKCGKKGHYADNCDLPFGVGGGFKQENRNDRGRGSSDGHNRSRQSSYSGPPPSGPPNNSFNPNFPPPQHNNGFPPFQGSSYPNHPPPGY
eukprot:TRINITY_DN3239_c0_g1_i1.p1 TRINITY_DN3239_c0_g1~~TRINITY_DN3239_c0_g1_i1.p1  ORF type:complete len:329 (-),score=39.13 TRINITY_DN3239_c0_g1_i1:110-1066(-)